MANYNADLLLVKMKANIKATDLRYDVQLQKIMDEVTVEINDELTHNGASLPAGMLPAPYPTKIVTAEALMTAGYFKEEKGGKMTGERTTHHILTKRGREKVQAFINQNLNARGRPSTFAVKGNSTRRLYIGGEHQ